MLLIAIFPKNGEDGYHSLVPSAIILHKILVHQDDSADRNDCKTTDNSGNLPYHSAVPNQSI